MGLRLFFGLVLTAIGLSRLKPLKPPGSKPAAAPKPRQPISAEAKAAQAALKAERASQQVTPGAAPTLRHSTRVRVEEAEQVRQRAEKVTSLACHMFTSAQWQDWLAS